MKFRIPNRNESPTVDRSTTTSRKYRPRIHPLPQKTFPTRSTILKDRRSHQLRAPRSRAPPHPPHPTAASRRTQASRPSALPPPRKRILPRAASAAPAGSPRGRTGAAALEGPAGSRACRYQGDSPRRRCAPRALKDAHRARPTGEAGGPCAAYVRVPRVGPRPGRSHALPRGRSLSGEHDLAGPALLRAYTHVCGAPAAALASPFRPRARAATHEPDRAPTLHGTHDRRVGPAAHAPARRPPTWRWWVGKEGGVEVWWRPEGWTGGLLGVGDERG